ncbi:sodium:solute symporter family protein [Piscinibacterium candidicorallinum]|uniref:Sodium:solute symporter family protein n=1 Tax=Piscinibacterium candidicorallinum TaxID=1793872 RepID=A0ABV7H1Z5_9BURK
MSTTSVSSNQAFFNQLKRIYGMYTGGFVAFVVVLAILEYMGVLGPKAIGYVFMFATIGLYAGIGVMSRTGDVAEYYVAGRRVPAVFNGMATGSDWMSAASFIGMAGTLYLQGYGGLAFIMGWTGGYCLVAFLLAPYLRKFGQFTIPDFLGARYGGNFARSIGIFAAILVSFVYVVAQIYGVGLITARFTGVDFVYGVFIGLAGILVCSFLGGMRAVTWTQVAQYIILIVAYMIPVVMIGIKHGAPVPQLMYGQVLEKVTAKEEVLIKDAKELEVREIHKKRAADLKARIDGLPGTWEQGRVDVQKKLDDLRAANAPIADIKAAEKAVADYPKSADAARRLWTTQMNGANTASRPLNGMPRHAEAFPGATEKAQDVARKNFLALVFCLMVGTAALPHILMRFYTTPSVQEARRSVFWSLFCIFLLYFSAPALAVLVKYDVFTLLVGTPYAELPAWAAAWQKVDGGALLTLRDWNADGIVQLAEMRIDPDVVVLATPEIAGLPYVISGLVAAGGLAAALSTADGLLLTMANALSHDLYYKMIDPNASTSKRIAISKTLLLIVALIAAYVTAQKPGDILFLVGAAFSLAASAFFPALVLGVFWKRANKWGAISGMIAGLAVTMYYMITRYPFFQNLFGFKPADYPVWWDIAPIGSGIFGISVGLITMIVVTLLTPAPSKETQEFVESVRYPNLKTA